MKRLVVELDDNLHSAMKRVAFLNDMTIKQYIIGLIQNNLQKSGTKKE